MTEQLDDYRRLMRERYEKMMEKQQQEERKQEEHVIPVAGESPSPSPSAYSSRTADTGGATHHKDPYVSSSVGSYDRHTLTETQLLSDEELARRLQEEEEAHIRADEELARQLSSQMGQSPSYPHLDDPTHAQQYQNYNAEDGTRAPLRTGYVDRLIEPEHDFYYYQAAQGNRRASTDRTASLLGNQPRSDYDTFGQPNTQESHWRSMFRTRPGERSCRCMGVEWNSRLGMFVSTAVFSLALVGLTIYFSVTRA
eukprot:GILJ01004023.1.p1 GENE.GILJ01004023.1~~GILJ01004023.1.p1  ORF type:complete len:254 (-),score=36.26 GILJ01004023.1:133-894(-)